MSRDTHQPLLRVADLEVAYRRDTVLDRVDLTVEPGEIVGLIGETGSGKTTLCRAILGFAPLRRGSVDFEGTDVSALSRGRLRKFRSSGAIQYVFQDPLASLDPDWTIERSVCEPIALGAPLPPGTTRRERAEQVFAEVGLDIEFLDRRPADLSGGQRQRVVIARALITRPRLLLCDEPVSALDAGNRILMLELFEQLRERYAMSIIFVSHDIGSIAGTCDRLAVLHDGVIVEDGPARDVVRWPSSAYARELIANVPALP